MAISNNFESKPTFLRNEINTHLAQTISKEFPFTLYEPMRYMMAAGGKRLRPIFLLLACEAAGGKWEEGLDAAVAIELLHNFTLIHDDVMDQDDTRRGRKTVHKKWDVNVAILAGDGLIALAYKSLLRTHCNDLSRLGSLFSNTLLEVCEGQAFDKEFESEVDVSLDDYFKMIKKKTASLFAMCAELGAIIGGGTEKTISELRTFGLNLGVGFQIQDDLLDVMANEELTGKTWGSDIRQKKKTMLLIHARSEASHSDREVIEEILAKPEVDRQDVLLMKDVFQKAGTLSLSSQMLDKHFNLARKSLNEIEKSEGRLALEYFLESVINRTH
ncbi:polyprenyl synthetase family protein [candidate division KSB1 bacterium]|nr:polyprenyl synthetase family protein [candidate division KSB1 bacterium]